MLLGKYASGANPSLAAFFSALNACAPAHVQLAHLEARVHNMLEGFVDNEDEVLLLPWERIGGLGQMEAMNEWGWFQEQEDEAGDG